ncbi:hypothetical protein, partial [Chryseobacterium sp. CH21]|uniref:hypothetical protein n=1 Tax=Chryseobacterium sp. CH21 TaxID=713556 RepID=UPI001E32917C
HNPNLAGERSSASLASPLKFLNLVPKAFEVDGKSIFCNMYGLSADQAVNSSLLGKDVVNYEYITLILLVNGLQHRLPHL